jgi:hypothetical protein
MVTIEVRVTVDRDLKFLGGASIESYEEVEKTKRHNGWVVRQALYGLASVSAIY